MAANPRAAAVAALVRQEQDGFSNLVLDAELRRQQLEGRDKAFASAIFYTVLEHRGTLDYILCQFLPKGLAKLDAPVREILRAALAQARYMQVPVSAAVNEAVKLTRAFKKSSASGLVNAVLRKACSYDLSTASFKNEVERLMVLGSAGRDVAEFLHKNYPDEALDILTYKADGGMTSLRANPLKGSADELCAKLLASGAKEAKRGIVPGSVLARFEGSPAENELFRQGYFHVEGQASQLAALCVDAQPGETVIDLCAAPGGKTILLAEQMHSTGRLYSCDAAENRVGLIRTAVQRMGLTNVEALCNDATKGNPALPQADRILADVPCSGLGILAKKPDLRYKKLEPAREAELLATQSAILDTAAQLLKAGGRLVYSTCTIDPAENQQQIAAFLARHPEFTVVEPAAALPAGMTAACSPANAANTIGELHGGGRWSNGMWTVGGRNFGSETVVGEARTWTFNRHQAGEVIADVLTDMSGLYLHYGPGAAQTLTALPYDAVLSFGDGTRQSVSVIALSGGADCLPAISANDPTAGSTAAGDFCLGVNVGRPGTLYVQVAPDGAATACTMFLTCNGSVVDTATGTDGIQELSYTCSSPGTYFFTSGKAFRIMGVRFSPAATSSAIMSIPSSTDATATSSAYNLVGCKVGPEYKGVVIQDGRKIVR